MTSLALLDWRRRVGRLYADIRAMVDPRVGPRVVASDA